MTSYRIQYSRENRYLVYIDADSPESAIEAFWLREHEGGNDEDELPTNESGPTGLSMTDRFGTPVVWGQPTTL